MLLQLISIIFSSCEGQAGCDNTLDSWVIRQVQEERDTVQTAILFEVLLEEPSSLHVDTHGREHHGEVVFVSIVDVFRGAFDQAGLSYDLCSNL